MSRQYVICIYSRMMLPKFRRVSYTAKQKLCILRSANEHGMRAAARLYGVDESNVRRWRKQKDELITCERTRKNFRGRRCFYPELEKYLATFVQELRANGKPVTRGMIMLKARAHASDFDAGPDFKASAGWCDKFMKRNGLALRRRTTICQKLPPQYEERLVSFQRHVIKLRSRKEYQMSDIGNADETPVYFDMLRSTTVHPIGDREVKVLSTGYEKCRITVMLCITADGYKLPPSLF